MSFYVFFFTSRRRHTRCALVTGVQTCALPIFSSLLDQAWHQLVCLHHVREMKRSVAMSVLDIHVASHLNQPCGGLNYTCCRQRLVRHRHGSESSQDMQGSLATVVRHAYPLFSEEQL